MARLVVTYLMILSIFLIGCGGRTAHPITSHQAGDENKTCDVLRDEIDYLKVQHEDKKKEHQVKEAVDIALLIGGILILVPFFFMDLKNAEKVEYEAINHRIEHLRSLAREMNCSFLHSTYVID